MMIRVNGREGTAVELTYRHGDRWPYVVVMLVNGWAASVSVVEDISIHNETTLLCDSCTHLNLASASDGAVVQQFIEDTKNEH